jgi:membrane-bound lytic murein transglycosylase D
LIPAGRIEGAKDLGWLQGIEPPDLPVRWDDRLVRLLDHYRTTPEGRAMIRELFRRAGRYGPMITRKLKEAGLPEDLIYVAMVESGFDPTVQSSAGAVGLWQFMKNTGDEYGLLQTRWVDERNNPERSTEAAVRLLGDLYQRLGSWELALAAYNMGHTSLLRAMLKYNTNDFWLLSGLEAGLPYETVFYVAKIMACAVIGHNLERFGLADLQPDPAVETAVVSVPGGLGLFRVAAAAGMKTEELAALNPDLKRGRVPPDAREWPVRIPAERRARFLQRWEKMRPQTPSHRKYVVRFGERLPDVARAYGTTEKSLRQLNELGDQDEVGPGVELLVPDVEPLPAPRAAPAALGVPARSFVYQDRSRVFYRVAPQDTLEEIARFFRVSSDEIVKWNGITPDAALPRGLFLQLFVPHGVDLARSVVITPEEARILVVGSDEFFDFHEAQRDRVRIRYRIRPGDTMQSLAERFELSAGSIARINRFSRYQELEPDKEIIVYVPKELAESLRARADLPREPGNPD